MRKPFCTRWHLGSLIADRQCLIHENIAWGCCLKLIMKLGPIQRRQPPNASFASCWATNWKILPKSILGASGIDLASIWCCKVESGWIPAGLGSICRRIGVYFSCIFEWIERGFCKQSLYEQYALIVALSIAFLLSRWFFSLTSGAVGCASRLELRPKCEKCDIEKHDVFYNVIDFIKTLAQFD